MSTPRPDPSAVTVPVMLHAINRRGRVVRPVAFHRSIVTTGQITPTWISDAVVALCYGNGRLVYPRAIVLGFDPRDALTSGSLVVESSNFASFRGAYPRLLGWICRGPDDRGWEATADPKYRDPDWSGSSPASELNQIDDSPQMAPGLPRPKIPAGSTIEALDDPLGPFFWERLSSVAAAVVAARGVEIRDTLAAQAPWAPLNCDLASRAWRAAFVSAGLSAEIWSGVYWPSFVEGGEAPGSADHTWLRVEGRIFDPTAGQFAGPIRVRHYHGQRRS